MSQELQTELQTESELLIENASDSTVAAAVAAALAIALDDNIKLQLKHVLELSTINHKNEILKETTIKGSHIYCKIHNLSGQVTGPLIENFIKLKYNMSKNSASLCIGDLKHNETNLEIKVSNGGQDNNKFNYVQLRMNHDCEYLFTAYYLNSSNIDSHGELFMFKLAKHDLKPIILSCGGYAHGTIKKLGAISVSDLDDVTNDKEYALRPKYGDVCWNMLLQFRIHDIIAI
jgi:hypothetical protein